MRTLTTTKQLDRLLQIISDLRGPQGCSWGKDQTLKSMLPNLLEECYECIEAIEQQEHEPPNNDLIAEELGDLLFNVLMLVQIGADENKFDLNQVCHTITEKMILRHPHVFTQERQESGSKEEKVILWEQIKSKKTNRTSRLDGIPLKLPALSVATRQGEKAASVGFDWPDVTPVLHKVEEEWNELQEAIKTNDLNAIEHELGDILMSLASLGRHLNTPAETALRRANKRFRKRFTTMEDIATQNNTALEKMDAQTLDALWEKAKNQLK
ncbi:MAG: nucleoside triphosphate pyrophosphohydrolase [Proteobacteria bacterium]|nr:nucleoside triphosphate pyrophosphohydrolase [Pseudomonadota bacterium]